MKFRLVAAAFIALSSAPFAVARDLSPGEILINSIDRLIETYELLITWEYVDGKIFDRYDYFDRPKPHGFDPYVAYILTNKKTGYKRRSLAFLDGNKEPYFRGLDYGHYCDVSVLFVSMEQSTPRYGGMANRSITTYIFRADTFEMLEEFTGTPYDVTRFDSRWVPEVDSIMDERYLVSCLTAGPGHPFAFGLIDRKRLYGPDWCGPGGARCRVAAPVP